MTRLPSFNDFSPGIIKDVRLPLWIVAEHEGDFEAIADRWAAEFFPDSDRKRASTNVSATIGNIGLFDRRTSSLTDTGRWIADAQSAQDGAARLIKHIIETQNGNLVIQAITSINRRAGRVTKASLKAELQRLGVEQLSSGTTDHTTLRNWMVAAGVLGPPPQFEPSDAALKALLGISAEEQSGILELPLPQQIFLMILRRLLAVSDGDRLQSTTVFEECLRDYPTHFDEDQLSAKVLRPLETAGWIILEGRSGRASGGKSGYVSGTERLLSIPIEHILPDFEAVIPADLRSKIDTPLSEINRLIKSDDKNDRGLGLELLALRMIIDLRLQPRSFRARSRDTAYAEVDLTAEGAHLLFSRWTWQCKCVKTPVTLSAVAKEVGLAIYSKSHVVVMLTTSDFTRDAMALAREISSSTHLQFLFINGRMVDAYLDRGASVLVEHVQQNAAQVMADKRNQPIRPEEVEE